MLLSAPTEEKRTKFAAVPNVGACPKFTFGIKNRIAADNELSSLVFILFGFWFKLISTTKMGI